MSSAAVSQNATILGAPGLSSAPGNGGGGSGGGPLSPARKRRLEEEGGLPAGGTTSASLPPASSGGSFQSQAAGVTPSSAITSTNTACYPVTTTATSAHQAATATTSTTTTSSNDQGRQGGSPPTSSHGITKESAPYAGVDKMPGSKVLVGAGKNKTVPPAPPSPPCGGGEGGLAVGSGGEDPSAVAPPPPIKTQVGNTGSNPNSLGSESRGTAGGGGGGGRAGSPGGAKRSGHLAAGHRPPSPTSYLPEPPPGMEAVNGFVSLEVRRALMDKVVERLKADLEAVKNCDESNDAYQSCTRKARKHRELMLKDAERHKRYLIESTEQISLHEFKEAETSFRLNVESVRESMLDECVSRARKLEEHAKTGGVAEDHQSKAFQRNTRSKAKVEDDFGHKGNGGNGVYKRRRGQSPVSAYLNKTLRKVEMERDICEMVSDDRFALRDLVDDEEAETIGRGSMRIRAERNCLHYGDVTINKGDGVLLTCARTDEQTIGTVTGVSEADVYIKIMAREDGVVTGTRKLRLSITDLADGVFHLDVHQQGKMSRSAQDGGVGVASGVGSSSSSRRAWAMEVDHPPPTTMHRNSSSSSYSRRG